MIVHPFPLLRRFEDRLSIALITKADRLRTDEEFAEVIHAKALASVWQVHGNRTIVAQEPTSRTQQADGLTTDVAGLTLTVRAADCQNFILYDPDRSVLCLLHAGWRSMKKRAITEAIRTMQKSWAIDPASLWVGAGPSLCRGCAEFSNPEEEVPELSAFIEAKTVDLQAAADAEFIACGVRPEQIDRPLGCTRCQPERFWTYRGGDRQSVLDGWTNCLAATLIGKRMG
jgi:copper oxidase (laccase) domain-containing protein